LSGSKSHAVPKLAINFSEVKVKVQGQNRWTENLPLQWFLGVEWGGVKGVVL